MMLEMRYHLPSPKHSIKVEVFGGKSLCDPNPMYVGASLILHLARKIKERYKSMSFKRINWPKRSNKKLNLTMFSYH